jgi:hypothetical protein
LTGGDPRWFDGLQSVVAEIDFVAARCHPAHSSALLFAEFCSSRT